MTPVDATLGAPVSVVETAPTTKTMQSSRCELSRVIWRSNENMFGSGKGTLILELVDDVAWATAARHGGGHAVTASIEHMIFRSPVWAGDVVSAYAQVEATGRTSMSIGVYVTAQRCAPGAQNGQTVPVAEAHLVFVAVDEDGNPRHVPGVHPETESEYAAARAVEIRREHRRALDRALTEATPGPAR